MQKRTSNGRAFQENLLDRLAETNQITTIYLRNRMSLRGRIREFDPYVLLLEPLDGGPATLVYKSAIVSISGPARRPGPPRRMPPRPSGGPRPPHQFAPPRGPAPFQRPDGGFSRPRPDEPYGGPPRDE
ncbi:MAG: Hfq protein [Armatimonadetes bacterium]|jgi:RNA chaperone Hfq|nr:Hfq protein [Armatimonadota bacterium]